MHGTKRKDLLHDWRIGWVKSQTSGRAGPRRRSCRPQSLVYRFQLLRRLTCNTTKTTITLPYKLFKNWAISYYFSFFFSANFLFRLQGRTKLAKCQIFSINVICQRCKQWSILPEHVTMSHEHVTAIDAILNCQTSLWLSNLINLQQN